MAETIKSVLYVDYDSLHRRLTECDAAAAGRLTSRLSAWIGAIEAGSLFGEDSENEARRRVLIRRCYSDPKILGEERSTFLANGFQIVDCPPAPGREHNAAAIHMVLDTVDALDHPTGYEEFIFLSTDTDLSPVLIRLRAHNRTSAIYANAETEDSYKAIADSMIDEEHFLSVLLSDDEPETEDEEEDEEATPPPAERSEIEALARKVSTATSVPLFAPRTYSELFRQLIEEISENGYHFQTTAEKLTERMAKAGRKVTRRQIVFVVKGLALKGHVFSSNDTADSLAGVFREQAIFLADNAGLDLDDQERAVMSSWIIGESPASGATVKPRTEKQENGSETKAPAKDAAKTPPAKVSNTPSSRAARRKQSRTSANVKPAEAPKASVATTKPETPKSAFETAKPTENIRPVTARPAQESSAATTPTAKATPPEKSDPMAKSTSSPDQKSASPSAVSSRVLLSSGSRLAQYPQSSRPAAKLGKDDEAENSAKNEANEAVENSILAAIAEAVDVLVEDNSPKSGKLPDDSDEMDGDRAEPTPPPPQADEDPEGDDIGDEIQRIIASYSRNRNQNDRR